MMSNSEASTPASPPSLEARAAATPAMLRVGSKSKAEEVNSTLNMSSTSTGSSSMADSSDPLAEPLSFDLSDFSNGKHGVLAPRLGRTSKTIESTMLRGLSELY